MPQLTLSAYDRLDMPLAERKERHWRMFAHLAVNDVDRWAQQFISALSEARQRQGVLDGLRHFFAFANGSNGAAG